MIPHLLEPAPPPAPASAEAAYRGALEFLYRRINYEQLPREAYSAVSFRLERMQALLESLGNPQTQLPAIHIAGTKGKGSTAAICAAVLQAAGCRVGLFTSPHIHCFEERMCVDGQQPSASEIVELVNEVAAAAQALEARGAEWSPTFFEFTTAMAWRLFHRKQVDFVVLEVGLGGRLDATNVCRPAVTVITSISRDHTRLLGDSLAEIAREKAGIIKPGVPVLSGVADPSAEAVISEVAAQKGAPHFALGREIRCIEARRDADAAPLEHWLARVATPWRTYPLLRVPLAGEHQVSNLALALAAADCALQDRDLNDADVARCLGALEWPLRIEVLRTSPLVVADASHNTASMEALLRTLRTANARRRIAVFSASRDKDVAEMLRLLAGESDQVILTQFSSNPRATPLGELLACAQDLGLKHVRPIESPLDAWRAARAEAASNDLICICGSFFLAAELREIVLQERDREQTA